MSKESDDLESINRTLGFPLNMWTVISMLMGSGAGVASLLGALLHWPPVVFVVCASLIAISALMISIASGIDAHRKRGSISLAVWRAMTAPIRFVLSVLSPF